MRRLVTIILATAVIALGTGLAAQAQTVTVSGAASLTAAFTDIKQAFEKANPGMKVDTNFAASGQLLAQIEAGAPVDVFASADQETMDQAQAKKLIVTASRRDFVTNALVLAKPKSGGHPAVSSMADLARPDVARVAMGQPETVPVGRYAREALTTAGLWDKLTPKIIFGSNVKQVLDYVSRGEVDAGFVFATDAKIASATVDTVAPIPTKTPVRYPLAVVAASKNQKAAQAFEDFVLGPEGQAILAKYGFAKP